MASYYTHYSFSVALMTEEEEQWVRRVLAPISDEEAFADDQDYEIDDASRALIERGIKHQELLTIAQQDGYYTWPGFGWEITNNNGVKSLWIHGDELSYPDHLDYFLQEFLRKFSPETYITYTYADTCGKPIINSFGGGIAFITAGRIYHIHTFAIREILSNRFDTNGDLPVVMDIEIHGE